MKKVSNLSDLLVENLKKMYSSEQLQHTALSGIRQKAHSGELRNAINVYEKAKEENLKRLQQCFDALDTHHELYQCDAVQTLLNDCQVSISEAAEQHVADAALIGTFQQVI